MSDYITVKSSDQDEDLPPEVIQALGILVSAITNEVMMAPPQLHRSILVSVIATLCVSQSEHSPEQELDELVGKVRHLISAGMAEHRKRQN